MWEIICVLLFLLGALLLIMPESSLPLNNFKGYLQTLLLKNCRNMMWSNTSFLNKFWISLLQSCCVLWRGKQYTISFLLFCWKSKYKIMVTLYYSVKVWKWMWKLTFNVRRETINGQWNANSQMIYRLTVSSG